MPVTELGASGGTRRLEAQRNDHGADGEQSQPFDRQKQLDAAVLFQFLNARFLVVLRLGRLAELRQGRNSLRVERGYEAGFGVSRLRAVGHLQPGRPLAGRSPIAG